MVCSNCPLSWGGAYKTAPNYIVIKYTQIRVVCTGPSQAFYGPVRGDTVDMFNSCWAYIYGKWKGVERKSVTVETHYKCLY